MNRIVSPRRPAQKPHHNRRRLLVESLEERRVLAAPVFTPGSIRATPIAAENSFVTLQAEFTDADIGQTYNLAVDWGDGTTQNLAILPGNTSFEFTHRYGDNDNGTISSLRTISFTLNDSGGESTSGTAFTRIENSQPSVTALAANNVVEGGTVTLDGTFTDRSKLNDNYAVIISWDGGQTFNFNTPTPITPTEVDPGNIDDFRMTFQLTHVYLDDNPTGTPIDPTAIIVIVVDNDMNAADLVSHWTFDEPAAAGSNVFDFRGAHNGTFGTGVTRVPGLIGPGALAFNNTDQAFVNVGTAGYEFPNGVSVEALIRPNWSGNMFDYDEIFRKEDGGNRILFSFQNDPNNGGAQPAVAAGPVLSFGLNVGGAYNELDMPLNVDLSALPGGNAESGTIFLNDPGVALGPNDVVLNGNTSHVVANYDRTTGEKAIFVNGKKRWSFQYAPGTAVTTGGGSIATIGNVSPGGSEPFTNIIDEVAIYSRGQTATEVAGHYARTQAGLNYFFTSTIITVANVAPAFDLGADDVGAEGQNFSRNGITFTDPGTDTFSGTVNYGDGTGVQPLTLVGNTFNLNHIYNDNGTFTVTVTLFDDDSGFTTDTFNVVVANDAPNVTAGPPQNVLEGATVTLPPSTFTDDSPVDTHTAVIDWGDGTVEAGTVNQALRFVNGTHVYADNGVYIVTVTVTDDDGLSGSDTFTVTVGNASPIVTAGNNQTVNEGQTVNLDPATYVDPGSGDTHTATIDWGDGTVVAGTVDQILNTVAGSHVYADNGSFVVTVTVTDDDGAAASSTFNVTVMNVAAVVDAGPDQSVVEGATVSLAPATFTDGGSADTHTATIDWGDGTVVAGTVDQLLNTVAGSHVYGGSGVFTVTVTVTDDDGAVSSDTLLVDVGNQAPVVNAGADQTANEGQTVNVAATFNDAGVTDTHTATINWGDGTTTAGVVDQLAGTVTGSHVYADNGNYTITVSVTDNDGGVGTDSLAITVNNVPPVITPAVGVTDDEGSPVTAVLATYTDAGSADTHTVLINWGDGTTTAGTATGGNITGTHSYDDDGVYIASITLTDDDGAAVSTNVTITINNVAPDVIIDGPASAVRGAPTSFFFSATDASPADLAAPIIYTIDWGDGSEPEVIEGPADGIEVTHVFLVESAPGEFLTVTANATDKDGDTGPDAFFDIEVKIFALVPNDDGFEDLVFGGTHLADRIVVSLLYGGGTQIRINSNFYKVPDASGKIIIYAGDGGDHIQIASNIGYDTELYGQNGNDYIAGGRFHDILDGGAGNDRLIDQNGNNTFIGGEGNDQLSAGKGHDVMFGGDGRDSINGGAGNDIIDAGAGNDGVTGFDGDDIIRGGDGSDVLRGERGNDILIGDAGNDALHGGTGRDILIGGSHADQFYGGYDDDILIHGATVYDADDFALLELLAEWLRPLSTQSRVNLLSDRLDSSSIDDDNSRDMFSGERDNDWFLFILDQDRPRDFRQGDIKTEL